MLPPSPRAKRATSETPPNAMSSRRTQLNGVSSLALEGLELDVAVVLECFDAAEASATA